MDIKAASNKAVKWDEKFESRVTYLTLLDNQNTVVTIDETALIRGLHILQRKINEPIKCRLKGCVKIFKEGQSKKLNIHLSTLCTGVEPNSKDIYAKLVMVRRKDKAFKWSFAGNEWDFKNLHKQCTSPVDVITLQRFFKLKVLCILSGKSSQTTIELVSVANRFKASLIPPIELKVCDDNSTNGFVILNQNNEAIMIRKEDVWKTKDLVIGIWYNGEQEINHGLIWLSFFNYLSCPLHTRSRQSHACAKVWKVGPNHPPLHLKSHGITTATEEKCLHLSSGHFLPSQDFLVVHKSEDKTFRAYACSSVVQKNVMEFQSQTKTIMHFLPEIHKAKKRSFELGMPQAHFHELKKAAFSLKQQELKQKIDTKCIKLSVIPELQFQIETTRQKEIQMKDQEKEITKKKSKSLDDVCKITEFQHRQWEIVKRGASQLAADIGQIHKAERIHKGKMVTIEKTLDDYTSKLTETAIIATLHKDFLSTMDQTIISLSNQPICAKCVVEETARKLPLVPPSYPPKKKSIDKDKEKELTKLHGPPSSCLPCFVAQHYNKLPSRKDPKHHIHLFQHKPEEKPKEPDLGHTPKLKMKGVEYKLPKMTSNLERTPHRKIKPFKRPTLSRTVKGLGQKFSKVIKDLRSPLLNELGQKPLQKKKDQVKIF